MSGAAWTETEMASLRAMFPTAKWPDVLAGLPRRTRDSINQQARLHGIRREISKRARWTVPEENVVRQLWPSAEPEVIVAALPGRAWANIAKKANDLNIKRPTPASRHNKRHIDPLIRQLRAERERRRITRSMLAEKLGYHVQQILAWEMGKARPLLPFVRDWAAALDMELMLRENASRLLKQSPSLVPREKLMAGRA
jgi:DNA-binding XRE family transcriptional regulator